MPAPVPRSSLQFLGEGRTQKPDLPDSPILLPPAPLPLSEFPPGLEEAKENRALPQLALPLSLTSCWEDGLLPPLPWLRTWPWCQVSPELPESEALPALKLDPSPLSISPFPCLFSLIPRLFSPISTPCSKVLFFRCWKKSNGRKVSLECRARRTRVG